MNRELKFRAWLPYEETMLYSDNQHEEDDLMEIWQIGETISVSIQEIYIASPGGNDPMECSRYVSPQQSIMQFTGLLDRNGVKIFEGDIIKLAHDWDHVGGHGDEHRVFKKETPKYKHYMIRVIEWSRGHHAYFVTNPQRCILDTSWLVEVIGNIHQNPELMEEQKNEL